MLAAVRSLSNWLGDHSGNNDVNKLAIIPNRTMPNKIGRRWVGIRNKIRLIRMKSKIDTVLDGLEREGN